MDENTEVDLYRSCRIEQFPNGLLHDLEPSPSVLYPDFYARGNRAPDVQIELIEGSSG